MTMKKVLMLLCAVLVISNVSAQDLRQYIGDCLVYGLSELTVNEAIYAVKVVSKTETTNCNTASASSIFLYDLGSSCFREYKTTYGNYKSFKYLNSLTMHNIPSEEQFVLFNRKAGGSCYYAFVEQNSNLYLVDVKTDAIISVFDGISFGYGDNIFVTSKGMDEAPNFYILDDGYLNCYWSYPSNSSSVRSAISENKDTNITYNLGGVEIARPRNEIYIQDGKKIIAK